MPKPPETSPVGDVDTNALLKDVMNTVIHDLDLPCDCPYHRLAPEERTAALDRAIEATNAEIRDGLLPEGDDE